MANGLFRLCRANVMRKAANKALTAKEKRIRAHIKKHVSILLKEKLPEIRDGISHASNEGDYNFHYYRPGACTTEVWRAFLTELDIHLRKYGYETEWHSGGGFISIYW